MSARREISSVTFVEGGLAIQFMDPATDIRVRGRSMLSHQIQLHSSHPDYEEAIEKLRDLVRDVLEDALEDFAESDPWRPEDDEDDDDGERGMGE